MPDLSKERAHMARIRAARGLPPQTRENLMHRTRAAVAYVGTTNSEAVRLSAFMALFHPEVPDERVRELIQDVKRGQRPC